MFGRLIRSLIVLLLTLAVAGGVGLYYLEHWAQKPTDITGEKVVELKPGMTLGHFAKSLGQAGVVTHGTLFHLWVRLAGNYQKYQAGKYRFSGSVKPVEIAQTIIKGDTWNPVVLQITVPEGFRLKEVAERLAANGVGHIVEINRLMTDKSFLASQSVPASTIEGFLYPATYSFHQMPTPEQALETMVKTFWQNLPKDYQKQIEGLGLTLAQAVTFASLVELETRLDEEKTLISEVIWRRLKDKVPLAIDAALIYGISDYDGNIKWSHLSDASNPYNTRIHLGLPPTPIGAPGVKSLEAVLHPTNFGYYYYVLIPGEGRHHFSKTLAEHNLHVKKLVNWSKRDKAKSKR